MSWGTPKIDWATDDVIATTDLNRIEENAVTLHKGNGQAALASITAANNLDINETDETFIVTGNTAIYYIKKTGRQEGNKIILHFTGTPTLHDQEAGPGGEYAKMKLIFNGNITIGTDILVRQTYVFCLISDIWRMVS
jgi:hypothetical protein